MWSESTCKFGKYSIIAYKIESNDLTLSFLIILNASVYSLKASWENLKSLLKSSPCDRKLFKCAIRFQPSKGPHGLN